MNAIFTQYDWLITLIIVIGASVVAVGIGLRIWELVQQVKRKEAFVLTYLNSAGVSRIQCLGFAFRSIPKKLWRFEGAVRHGRRLSFGKSVAEDWQANPRLSVEGDSAALQPTTAAPTAW
jgi:hypothetical protein